FMLFDYCEWRMRHSQCKIGDGVPEAQNAKFENVNFQTYYLQIQVYWKYSQSLGTAGCCRLRRP
ncbi:MAG: hypothetical protein J1E39_06375, partial [Eubacterium sp.]|nr:hypothetical protein [Eubacterium sp.]